jgi:hypothetical protein
LTTGNSGCTRAHNSSETRGFAIATDFAVACQNPHFVRTPKATKGRRGQPAPCASIWLKAVAGQERRDDAASRRRPKAAEESRPRLERADQLSGRWYEVSLRSWAPVR